jgi:GAF domain-containing protein
VRDQGPVPVTESGDFSGDWRQWFPRWPAAGGPTDPDRPATFAAALADLVHTLQQEGINDDTHALSMITQGAVGMIAGAEQGGIVVPVGPGQLDSRAAVGDLAPLVMKQQNQVGEGPCLNAVLQSAQILVTDLRQDNRWPAFSASIAQCELRSVLCTPMRVQQATVGSLTLLSTRPDAFGDAAANLAAVSAAHATLALTTMQQIGNLQTMPAPG